MMFADDTKIFGAPGPVLQLDVDKASEWACKWQMNFNINKCKVLHFTRQEDLAYEYRMPDNNTICTITATNKEKDMELYLIITYYLIAILQLRSTNAKAY